MIQLPRSNWLLAALMVLAAALGAATLRAAARSVMTGPSAQQPQVPATPAAAATPTATPAERAVDSPPPSAPGPRDVTPPVPSAPDSRGSADNNVSFPVDI